MTAAAPAGCGANIAFFLPATFATAWWRSRKTNICSATLFQYRFPAGRGLAGHSFGNLFLTALTNVTGDFPRSSARVGAGAGDSRADFSFHGAERDARSRARRRKNRCRARRIFPDRANGSRACAWCRAACARCRKCWRRFAQADLILVGPGSLYTSIIPNLLVEEVVEAIAQFARYMRVHRQPDDAARRNAALLGGRSRARNLRAHPPEACSISW